jgi:hypothetical protein
LGSLFGIWIFRPRGTGLFLKIVRKDPFILRTYYFEGYFAKGTEDEIPWPLGSFKGDIGVTDRTFQLCGHGWPPSGFIEILLFEIEEKIKSPLSPNWVAIMTEGEHSIRFWRGKLDFSLASSAKFV